MKIATTINSILRLAESGDASLPLLSDAELAAVFGGSGGEGGGGGSGGGSGGSGGSGGNPGGLVFRPDQHIGELRIVEDVRVLNPGLPDGTPSGNGEAYDRAYFDHPRPETQAAYDTMVKAADNLEAQGDKTLVYALNGDFGTAIHEGGQAYNNYQAAEANYVETGARENGQASYDAHVTQQMANGNNVEMPDHNVSNSDGSPGYGTVETTPTVPEGTDHSDGTAYGPPEPNMTNLDGQPDLGGTQGDTQGFDGGQNETPADANMSGSDGIEYASDTSSGGYSSADANMSMADGSEGNGGEY